MNAQVFDLDFFFNFAQEEVFVNSDLLSLFFQRADAILAFLFCFEGILDKINVSYRLFGIITINLRLKSNLYDRVIFLIRQMEIYSGQDLSKLFGRHFLMTMSVPVLEKTLDIQPIIINVKE
jgi:hypothetical protein